MISSALMAISKIKTNQVAGINRAVSAGPGAGLRKILKIPRFKDS
jgi:hypothetical protein